MSSGFQAYLEDMFCEVPGIGFRRMFGGTGIFRDGVMIGLVVSEVLYLKADDGTAARFESEGKGAFVYSRKGEPVSLSYYEVPDRLFEDPEDFRAWVDMATHTALAAQKKTRRKR
ncbi:MAG: TfoX/Sxy family protein [Rhodobiaceae bacterium]|nr:TfoX/Sxy family protein [Rhodobiaceae bacterium]